MGSCHRLTCGARGRPRRSIRADITRGGVSVERSLAYHRHLKHPGLDPSLQGFQCLSRPLVFRVIFLKVGQNPLGAVNRPRGQYFWVGLFHKR